MAIGRYADVNGLRLYYEDRGTGRPLVLLHGGLLTIDLSFGAILPALSATRRTLGVDLQGHGRTPDVAREPTPDAMADDVVALLDHLDIERADLFGFSAGALVSMAAAVRHPDRVGRQVFASGFFRPDGYYEEIRTADPNSTRMPTAQDFALMRDTYRSEAPDPDHFEAFAARFSASIQSYPGWTDEEMRAVAAPTLVLLGDHDFLRPEHAAELVRLLPHGNLAVLPGRTHMNLLHHADLVLPVVEWFLAAGTG